jgi:exodeoxyribonuclease V alpha subunit
MMNLNFNCLRKSGCFSDIDIHLADFLAATGGESSDLFRVIVMMLSSALDGGDVCLSLENIAGKPLSLFIENDDDGFCRDFVFPLKKEILGCLKKSRAVGDPGSYLPLIIEEDRLYFHKYHYFETALAQHIRDFIFDKKISYELPAVSETFSLLFRRNDGETDWQAVAAYSALAGGLTVISGGPGTGKTSTVVKILVLLIDSAIRSGQNVSIALAAPTGKAAARLRESVNLTVRSLPVNDEVKRMVPAEAFTIHRLLGSSADSHEFRHNRENPLPHDVVVIDECSMGDMALMFRLAQSVRPGARLILLGDRDQLSSVEGGSVFGDICAGTEGCYSGTFLDCGSKVFGINFSSDMKKSFSGRMNDSLVVLKKSYRFSSGSGIGLLADMIRSGDVSGALGILYDRNFPDVKLVDGSSPGIIENIYLEMISPLISGMSENIEERIFSIISGLSILTATVRGKNGSEGMNYMAEKVLYGMGVINPADKFYDGRPVMVTGNDYSLSLFNGDVGIASGRGKRVVFQAGNGEWRDIHPSRLPGM